MKCPICIKRDNGFVGDLVVLGPLIICAFCQSAWNEVEFLEAINKAGLKYFFKGSVNGPYVIYDPEIEKHDFIEKSA